MTIIVQSPSPVCLQGFAPQDFSILQGAAAGEYAEEYIFTPNYPAAHPHWKVCCRNGPIGLSLYGEAPVLNSRWGIQPAFGHAPSMIEFH